MDEKAELVLCQTLHLIFAISNTRCRSPTMEAFVEPLMFRICLNQRSAGGFNHLSGDLALHFLNAAEPVLI
nr:MULTISPECIES: hypothetical protein [unclassified Martelella]